MPPKSFKGEIPCGCHTCAIIARLFLLFFFFSEHLEEEFTHNGIFVISDMGYLSKFCLRLGTF